MDNSDHSKNEILSFLHALTGNQIHTFTPDYVNEWRYNNQIQILAICLDLIKSNNLNPRKIGIKDLFKYLEYASFEDSELIQEKWACLLVNSIEDKDMSIALSVFSEILHQLNKHEINILELLFVESFQNSSESKGSLSTNYISKVLGIEMKPLSMFLNNLQRLSLIISIETNTNQQDEWITSRSNRINICLSELGVDLISRLHL